MKCAVSNSLMRPRLNRFGKVASREMTNNGGAAKHVFVDREIQNLTTSNHRVLKNNHLSISLLLSFYISSTPQIDHKTSKHESILVRQRRGLYPACLHCMSKTDNPQGDQRLPHDSRREVSAAYLSELGVLYYHIPSETDVDKLASERHYKNRDMITVSPEKMGAIYEEKVKSFFHEHLHEDEEIRYIRDGTGFFDVRSEGDEWVRIFLEKDDLIVGCIR